MDFDYGEGELIQTSASPCSERMLAVLVLNTIADEESIF